MVLYNDTALRVMCEFLSRGTPALAGLNWTTNSQEAGDFGVNNINTDIPEQVYRSLVDNGIQITSDTGIPQGVAIDTLAILNHNLTKSATVSLQGADNAGFAPIGTTINITPNVRLNDMYFIAPTLPSQRFRYWRLLIDDVNNADGFIEIGIVVFGNAKIFSNADCIENPLVPGKTDFNDVIRTEGFTNISNRRAVRKKLGLSFDKMNNDIGNFDLINEIFDFALTSLKCLWIPTPQRPHKYAMFAKLVDLPEQPTVDNDESGVHTDLEISLDESL